MKEVVYFLCNKTNRPTNFSKFILLQNSTCFGQFLCPSSGVLYCIYGTGIYHASLMTASKHVQDGILNVLGSCHQNCMTYTSAGCTVEYSWRLAEELPGESWKCLEAVIKMAWHMSMPNVQWKTHDDGQRNCPKLVDFLDQNKFGNISASVGFIKKKFVTMHGHMNVKHLCSVAVGSSV